MTTETKHVFLSTTVPNEVVEHAQVAILTEATWHLIGPAPYRAHGLLSFAPLPEVHCPVVDITPIPSPGMDEKVREIILAHTDPRAGVTDLDGLLAGLGALGAKVTRVEEGSVTGYAQAEVVGFGPFGPM